MNIQKTNKIGIALAQKGFIGGNGDMSVITANIPSGSPRSLTINKSLFRHSPKQKIVRVSKSVIEACKLIDINSIRKYIDESNFDFKSMIILLDNDVSGLIKIERYGSDISFLMMSDLILFKSDSRFCYNSYSFVSKSFSIEREDEYIHRDLSKNIGDRSILDYDKSVFVVQLLTYILYGDITKRFIRSKMATRINSIRFLNNSKLNIIFCDTLWKQRISTEGFKVRGHFRLQPFGECMKKRKLIWIEEFEKKGYNRKATVEMA